MGSVSQHLNVLLWRRLRRGNLWNLKLADLHLDGPQPYVVFKMLKRKVGKKSRWVTVPLFGAAPRAIEARLPILPKLRPGTRWA